MSAPSTHLAMVHAKGWADSVCAWHLDHVSSLQSAFLRIPLDRLYTVARTSGPDQMMEIHHLMEGDDSVGYPAHAGLQTPHDVPRTRERDKCRACSGFAEPVVFEHTEQDAAQACTERGARSRLIPLHSWTDSPSVDLPG